MILVSRQGPTIISLGCVRSWIEERKSDMSVSIIYILQITKIAATATFMHTHPHILMYNYTNYDVVIFCF